MLYLQDNTRKCFGLVDRYRSYLFVGSINKIELSNQALRLPKEFSFPGTEVFIRRDPVTGEVILSPKPASWAEFFELADRTKIPADFMADREDFQRFLEFASKLNISH